MILGNRWLLTRIILFLLVFFGGTKGEGVGWRGKERTKKKRKSEGDKAQLSFLLLIKLFHGYLELVYVRTSTTLFWLQVREV